MFKWNTDDLYDKFRIFLFLVLKMIHNFYVNGVYTEQLLGDIYIYYAGQSVFSSFIQ